MGLPLQLPLPEPLRAAEIPSFTHYSVVKRLPDIARRALDENQFSVEVTAKIQTLIDEIPDGVIRPVEIPLARDAQAWSEYIRPYEGMDWLQVPWFFAEEYFYVRILEAIGYFAPGSGRRVDPYLHQKQMGLESTQDAVRALADQLTHALYSPPAAHRDSLVRLLLADLWGNQNDLSMWPAQKGQDGKGSKGSSAGEQKNNSSADGSGKDDLAAARQHILADDTKVLLDYLDSCEEGTLRVDILLDNAGYELVTDLALADFLLSTGYARQVVLHAKKHPVFVSDALNKDIHATLDFLAFGAHLAAKTMAVRLRQALVNGTLVLQSHPFWTSPLPCWQLPDELLESLRDTQLLISKGDANYRRLLGDRHWQIDLPFSSVVGYMPCAVLALRTLKSEIAVGIEKSNIPTTDEDWMINGRWGLVQFAPPVK